MVQEATQQRYYYGTGKRKRAIAKVRLYPDTGRGEAGMPVPIQINGKPLDEAFPGLPGRQPCGTPSE